MDETELMDDMERFETESALADLAVEVSRSFEGVPADPAMESTLFTRFGGLTVDIGAVIYKMGHDDRRAVFS